MSSWVKKYTGIGSYWYRLNKKAAFTLIELLVVIAIIGILSGLIIVSMSGVTQKASIAKAQVFSNSLKNSLMMNLVSEWKFDSPVTVTDGIAVTANYLLDTWGSENGTVTTTPPTALSGSNCIYGSCIGLNGSQYASIPYDQVFKFGNQMTAMVWVKGSAANTKTIISNYENTVANKGSWWVGTNTVTPFNKLRVVVTDDGSYNSTHSKEYYTTSVIVDNTWHYVGFTFNNGTLKLYVDGVDSTVTQTFNGAITSIFDPNISLNIGAYLSNSLPAGYFTGSLDEIRLYNAAIPTSQIKEQYYAGLNKLLISGATTKEEYLSKINNIAKE